MNTWHEKHCSNLLLIAGTGRNSGKTSFVCRICEEWDSTLPLVCIKISNHFHLQKGSKPVYVTSDYAIYEETKAISDKDTERMLKAGASNVFFIEADHEFVYKAFQRVLEKIPGNAAIICESGTLRRYIKPSLFVMLHTLGTEPKESSKDLMTRADKVFYFEKGNFQLPDKSVVFTNNHWKINNT
jgi:Ni2+-binding GTPase involved in maturation of urease and hydrogenase